VASSLLEQNSQKKESLGNSALEGRCVSKIGVLLFCSVWPKCALVKPLS